MLQANLLLMKNPKKKENLSPLLVMKMRKKRKLKKIISLKANQNKIKITVKMQIISRRVGKNNNKVHSFKKENYSNNKVKNLMSKN